MFPEVPWWISFVVIQKKKSKVTNINQNPIYLQYTTYDLDKVLRNYILT